MNEVVRRLLYVSLTYFYNNPENDGLSGSTGSEIFLMVVKFHEYSTLTLYITKHITHRI